MIRFCFIVLAWMVSLSSCLVPQNNDTAGLSVVRTIRPEYAEGFLIQEMSDSSFRITLLNLEHLPDTLQQISWRPQEISRIACLSTTHIPFIKKLGLLHLVSGSGFTDLVVDPDVRRLIESGQIVNLTIGHKLDDEKVFGSQPDIMFVYPYGGEEYVKFLEAGIGCIQISEYLEKSPLARAEWMKLFGVLLNREREADSLFQEIRNAYLQHMDKVKSSSAERPAVFTGSYDGGFWYMPPGNSFAAALIRDAGGRYIYEDSLSGGNLVYPFEKVLADAHGCDFWGKIIFEKGPLTAEKLTEGDARLQSLKSFQNRNVFYCNAAETDYHGMAVLEPEVMLADLIAIFHPEQDTSHVPVYFRKWE
jgi:iron complex transport system substrate-binding protein